MPAGGRIGDLADLDATPTHFDPTVQVKPDQHWVCIGPVDPPGVFRVTSGCQKFGPGYPKVPVENKIVDGPLVIIRTMF
jgi:hypothetical protein